MKRGSLIRRILCTVISCAVLGIGIPINSYGYERPGERVKSSGSPGTMSSTPAEPMQGSRTRNGRAQKELFPLYGVTIGKTTVAELARLGVHDKDIDKRTGKPYPTYIIKGYEFWYDNGVADSMYLVRGMNNLPDKWLNMGLSWTLSYKQWISLLKRLGYSVAITQSPRVGQWQGERVFEAKVEATKRNLSVELKFNYSTGTTSPDDTGTLYSIYISLL
jgi:hypothetical protein